MPPQAQQAREHCHDDQSRGGIHRRIYGVGVIVVRSGSLAVRPLVQALLSQDRRKIIDVDAVAHAGVFLCVLHNGDVTVAVVIAGGRAVKHSESFDFAAIQSDDLVAVLRFSSVSVVHEVLLLVFG
jgi:hypothetical protein